MPYLQHAKDWTVTREAIMRLSARLGHEFTYGELNEELKQHDNVEIDGRGYAGALEAVARGARASGRGNAGQHRARRRRAIVE